MRLSVILVMALLISYSVTIFAEDIPLKLNQKDVDISGKLEKFFVLFSEPPLDVKLTGPAKLNIIVRKIIDKKNPLTKLPVNVTVNLDNKKVKDITLNDREGSAVIKDATMFNAGGENIISVDVAEGEHTLQIVVSKSGIKGILIKVEKMMSEKPVVVAKTPEGMKKEEKKDEFIPPIIPPLVPLVPPQEKKAEVAPPIKPERSTPSAEKKEEKKEEKAVALTERKETPVVEKAVESKVSTPSKRGFGDIVILSIKGGTILPLQYGNPGGYGEFSTSFHIYRGFQLGVSLSSYNINRDYLINDPMTGNSILKYHLHAVPISGFFGYKYQMQNIIAQFELGAGINMIDVDLRREFTSENVDTINSFQMNLASDMSYITKYGAFGAGIKYLYSNASNFDKTNGFIKDINAGGLIITIGYHYGF